MAVAQHDELEPQPHVGLQTSFAKLLQGPLASSSKSRGPKTRWSDPAAARGIPPTMGSSARRSGAPRPHRWSAIHRGVNKEAVSACTRARMESLHNGTMFKLRNQSCTSWSLQECHATYPPNHRGPEPLWIVLGPTLLRAGRLHTTPETDITGVELSVGQKTLGKPFDGQMC